MKPVFYFLCSEKTVPLYGFCSIKEKMSYKNKDRKELTNFQFSVLQLASVIIIKKRTILRNIIFKMKTTKSIGTT